jgi:hypothetical protein
MDKLTIIEQFLPISAGFAPKKTVSDRLFPLCARLEPLFSSLNDK